MATVALATTHRGDELAVDLVLKDLSALSTLVTERGVEISVRR
jgi:mannitol-1-/sugar-/sorbitol-6-phosphatase